MTHTSQPANRAASLPRARGFTLVEVMVTMAVIGMLALTVSFVVPDQRDDSVQENARVLYERINYAREFALVRSAILGLRVDDNGTSYRFLQFTDGRWQELNYRGLRRTSLDEQVSLAIETADLALLEQDDTDIDEVFAVDEREFTGNSDDEDGAEDDAEGSGDRAKLKSQPTPQLFIFGSGDLAPFTITLRDDFALRAGTEWKIASENGIDITLSRGDL
ncbi:pilus assembly FimT family protein [Pseudidiomarina donghaiensis]|uniref:Type II secretion system protein GspH n=1 Tax=Pseudidiomarina donghaiensis TaxID=519452 RepID=A0A432XKR4_9GAMM|nr:prepilin-type N-terminal cleavage/methylation domain-containing protein [Pseudidiomarina donghaiensis]RUO49287.1 type II secretion system protein GspH [Pseudidiomarina donghaiensis]SFV20920.1 Type II transport protein GspH [Pseudidiomarina donghaiensis]